MADACRIPGEFLQNMTAPALLQSVLDYPLIFDAFLHDSMEKGLNQASQSCNALEGLLTRDDLRDALHARGRL